MSSASSQTIDDLKALGASDAQIEQFQQTQKEEIDYDQEKSTEETIELIKSELEEKDEEEQKFEEAFGYTGRQDFFVETNPKASDNLLKKFGYDYFINRPTTFAPLSSIPVPSDYIIGPGDEIKLILFGNKNLTYSLRVTRDGDIQIPEIGPISTAGLTFLDLKETIDQIISSQTIGTQASVTLGELKSINIFVLGEASQPGMYTVGSLSTMTNALFASGGVSNAGSLRKIQLKRNGKVVSNFDLYDLLLNGDASDDSRLMSGDIIFINPVEKTVAITGEVQRPGIYELLETETAEDLINYSGSVKATANLSSAEITRISQKDSGYKLISADLNKNSASDLSLRNGDTLSIYPIENRIDNAILIKGHFTKPGFFPWFKGMKLSDLFSSLSDLLPMTDLNYVLVQRNDENGAPIHFEHLSILDLFENPEGESNIQLNDKDEITLFPNLVFCDRTQLEEDEFSIIEEQIVEGMEEGEVGEEEEVKDPRETCRRDLIDPIVNQIRNSTNNDQRVLLARVNGNVNFPGEYPLTEGATVEDMILAAGNLDELSYTSEIEIRSSQIKNKEVIKDTRVGSYEKLKNNLVQSRDTITIKRIDSDYKTASISGEVFFPGQYVIERDETLLSLIRRAGGLTEKANTDNLYFIRKSLAEQQLKNLLKSQSDLQKQLILIQAEGTVKDTTYIEKLKVLAEADIDEETLGRLLFDYNKIVSGETDDITLRDGDDIFIQSALQTVTVIGEVYAPNTHVFNKEMNLEDYILASGGANTFGSLSDAYIIKGDGSVLSTDSLNSGGFFRNNEAELLSGGDTIVVPLEVKTYPGLKLGTDLTQIIYQLAVATAAVNSF